MFIISDEVQPILGCKSCEQMALVKQILAIERKIESGGTHVDFDVFKEFADIYDGFCCLRGTVNIKLKDNAVPIIQSCQ